MDFVINRYKQTYDMPIALRVIYRWSLSVFNITPAKYKLNLRGSSLSTSMIKRQVGAYYLPVNVVSYPNE